MTEPVRMLVYFAHPDDESFGFAGSLSMLADMGAQLTYVCATRGEVGEILVDGLTTPDQLGPYREGELRAALKIIGVQDLRLLGYRDSGMAGTPPNEHPAAFVNQDPELVATRVADIILETKPQIMLLYGPDGIYGHPDHVFAHVTGMPAIAQAAARGYQVPNVYFSAASRERVQKMASMPGNPFSKMSQETLSTFGTPSAEITTWIDIRSVRDRKLAALMAHRTQVGNDGPFANLAPELRDMWFSVESARTVPTEWNPSPTDVLLSLLPEAPADHPLRNS